MYRGQASVSTSYLQFIPQSIKGGDRGEDDDDVGSRFVWKVHVVVAGGFLFFLYSFFKMQQKKVFQDLIRVPSPDCKVCREGFECSWESMWFRTTPKSPQWSNFFAKLSALVWEFSKLCSDWLQTDFYLTWSSSKSLVLLSSAWIPFAVWTTNETNRVKEQLVTVRPVHPTCWQQICRSVIYLKTCWCSTYAGVYPRVNFTCGATFN